MPCFKRGPGESIARRTASSPGAPQKELLRRALFWFPNGASRGIG